MAESPVTNESTQHSQAPLHQKQKTGMSFEEPAVTRPNGSGIRKRTAGGTEEPMSRTPSQGSRKFTMQRAATVLFHPDKPVGKGPTFWRSIVAIITASWLNVLLLFIPVSWALNFALPKTLSSKDTIVFVTSFLAIIPLAKLLAFATDDVSLRVGQTLAGLMNATLGNAVELIVSILALVKCELQIVQSSLIGSILSNLLLVLGMCFFAGGVKFSEQGFGASATQLNSSLLTLAVIAVLLPAAFNFASEQADEHSDILSMSHGVALILLFIYASYLFFQLYSHATMYDDRAVDIAKSTTYARTDRKRKEKKDKADAEKAEASNNATDRTSLDSSTRVTQGDEVWQGHEEEDDPEEPKMTLVTGVILLVTVTVLVAVTAEWLVDAIDGMTESGAISKEFVGIILLPIVGNAAEHATAVTVSVKDKLTLSLQVAVGSSIQIALFVIPLIVTIAWIMGKPLTLLFDPYESIALFLSVLTVNYVVQDGKSNWLEGLILMCLYVILAVTFWYYEPAHPITC